MTNSNIYFKFKRLKPYILAFRRITLDFYRFKFKWKYKYMFSRINSFHSYKSVRSLLKKLTFLTNFVLKFFS